MRSVLKERQQPFSGWLYSPVPAVERAVRRIREKYPALYPDGLERPRNLLEKLGNPHHRLPFTFHVAGTNGKGSTLAFLQAVFEAGGLSVHKYISPHLVRFEERIVLSGKDIEPDLFLSLIDEVDAAADGTKVSFFEFFTALAFLAYSRHPADALLLETGLGGLHDATNVIEGKDIVSILTRISHDHNRVLGDTLAEIAAHKAGIIKPGCPAVIAPQAAEVLEVFAGKAGRFASVAGRDWQASPVDGGFEYKSAACHFKLPQPRLLGRHQVANAGAAIAALEKSPYAHLLKQEVLEKAMGRVTWPGRLQRMTAGRLVKLLPEGWELWLDGAHNDSGAEIVAEQAKVWGKDKPLHLVTAMKKTKDTATFYRTLLPYVETLQAVDVSGMEVPMTAPEVLCDQALEIGYVSAKTAANLESAIRALTFQFKAPQRILVAGSLYLVGLALRD